MRGFFILLSLWLASCQQTASKHVDQGGLSAGSEDAKTAADNEFIQLVTRFGGTVTREEIVQDVFQSQAKLSLMIAASSEDENPELGRCIVFSSKPLKVFAAPPDLFFNASGTLAYSDDQQEADSCLAFATEHFEDNGFLGVSFFSYTF